MNGYAAPAPASDPYGESSYGSRPDALEGGDEASSFPSGGVVTAGASYGGGGGGGGGGSHYMAMPQLLGAPAYARPPRVVAESPRPLDPDDLPIEAMRSPEDQALLSAAPRQPGDDSPATIQPSSQGGLRAVASRFFGSSS